MSTLTATSIVNASWSVARRLAAIRSDSLTIYVDLDPAVAPAAATRKQLVLTELNTARTRAPSDELQLAVDQLHAEIEDSDLPLEGARALLVVVSARPEESCIVHLPAAVENRVQHSSTPNLLPLV